MVTLKTEEVKLRLVTVKELEVKGKRRIRRGPGTRTSAEIALAPISRIGRKRQKGPRTLWEG